MFDIPNFVTLPIELGVAVLMLIMDRRQRRLENESVIRFQQQQKEARETEIRQRERFNNFVQESSKRQIMLLESIMATLDGDRIDDFKSEVSSRYAQELTQDMEDLDVLLEKKIDDEVSDPELEANIESKIEEIESAKDFIKHFLPKETVDQISSIAHSANSAYEGLRDLPEVLKKNFPNEEGKIKVEFDNMEFEVDPKDKSEINQYKKHVVSSYRMERSEFLESLNQTVQSTLDEVKKSLNENLPTNDSSADKIVESVKTSLMKTMGLGNLIKKATEKASKNKNTNEDQNSTDTEND